MVRSDLKSGEDDWKDASGWKPVRKSIELTTRDGPVAPRSSPDASFRSGCRGRRRLLLVGARPGLRRGGGRLHLHQQRCPGDPKKGRSQRLYKASKVRGTPRPPATPLKRGSGLPAPLRNSLSRGVPCSGGVCFRQELRTPCIAQTRGDRPGQRLLGRSRLRQHLRGDSCDRQHGGGDDVGALGAAERLREGDAKDEPAREEKPPTSPRRRRQRPA
jgi:hypothetical protein